MGPKAAGHKDAAQDIARDLAEIASHIGQLKGNAHAYLSDPNYDTLKHRLENAHSAVEAKKAGGSSSRSRDDENGKAAVEARRRVRLNEGR